MKFGLATAALVGAGLLAGCATATIGLRSTNSTPIGGGVLPPGGSYSSGAIQADLDVPPGAFIGVLLLGYLAAGVHGDYLNWGYARAARESPQLAEDRAIAERDCSRPMEAPSANLRCR